VTLGDGLLLALAVAVLAYLLWALLVPERLG
jgi:F subunit of K+-transporting ATPase (Potass_KdpF)